MTNRKITRACEEAGVMLVVCHVLRYFPPVVKIKELIESGALGKVTFSSCFFCSVATSFSRQGDDHQPHGECWVLALCTQVFSEIDHHH